MSFKWSNFSRGTQQELARAAGLRVSRADEDLTEHFGEPPGEAFIEAVWPALRDGWFKRNPEAREKLVEALRSSNLGRSDLSVRTRAGQMAYLRSCRQSEALRRTALSLFRAAGERPFTESATATEPAASGSLDHIARFQQACGAMDSSALPMIEFAVAVAITDALRRMPTPLPADDRAELGATLVGAAIFAFVRHHRDAAEWQGPTPAHRALVLEGAKRLGGSRDACMGCVESYTADVVRTLREESDQRTLRLICTAYLMGTIAYGSSTSWSEEQSREIVSGLGWLQDALDAAEASARGSGTPEPTAPAAPATESFAEFIDRQLRTKWNPIGPHRVRDDKMGWLIRHGSTTVAIHAVSYPDHPELLRYRADLVKQVPVTPELLQTLNELNRREIYVKVYCEEEVVVLEYDQMAFDLSQARIIVTLEQFLEIADALDTMLQDRFGGTTFAGDVKAAFHV